MTAPMVTSIPLQPGLSRLADEVRLVQRPPRQSPPPDGMCSLFEAELRLGLEAADVERAYEAAAALWRRSGDLGRCHAAISRVLTQVGIAWADGRCSMAAEHRVSAATGELLARLRAGARRSGGGRVVLATPPGDPHVLALSALAHQVEEARWSADVVGDLPAAELAEAAVGAAAVVLSVHRPCRQLPAVIAAVRAAEPGALLVAGGPAACASLDVDLLTSDPAALLQALDRRSCPLSLRERDVLRCVADGLTNAEAGVALGISAATLKTHLDRIFDKSGANGRAAAVAIGLRRGWIS